MFPNTKIDKNIMFQIGSVFENFIYEILSVVIQCYLFKYLSIIYNYVQNDIQIIYNLIHLISLVL